MVKPDFAGDLRERVARAIYANRPDCLNKPWPVETAEQRRAYPHNPIVAVDLSYEYADAALLVIDQAADEDGDLPTRLFLADSVRVDIWEYSPSRLDPTYVSKP